MADENLTELTENESPALEDLIYSVYDPSGTPVDRKVTLQNVMELAPHFVDRTTPAAFDFVVGDFTTDETWNELDLSSIVPAGATHALLSIVIWDNVANSTFRLRKVGDSLYCFSTGTNVAWMSAGGHALIGLDSNRKCEYWGTNLAFAGININVLGWIIDTVN